MHSEPASLIDTIGFGLVLGSMVLAWLLSTTLGGWKFGSLLRKVEVDVSGQDVNAFVNRVTARVFELGFVPGPVLGRYFQGSGNLEPLGVQGHAKTKKQLDIGVDQSNPAHPKVLVALQYLSPIIGDTGETAYRDAILDYVTGKTDSIKVVPNRSFLALAGFVGGIVACATLLASELLHSPGAFSLVMMVGFTYAATSAIGVIGLYLKKGQATGMAFAVIGFLTSLAAIVTAVSLKLSGHN